MRAMRNNKTRLVFLLTAILLLQAVSGFPHGQATNAVGYVSPKGKQKRSAASPEAAAATPVEAVHISLELPSAEKTSVTTTNEDNLDEQVKGDRVARSAEVDARVKEVVCKQLDVSASEVKRGTSFSELGADSLDHVELIMAIEEEFDMEIPDEDTEKLTTYGTLCDYVNKHHSH